MALDLSGYADARELFSAVRDASAEADRTLRTLRRMEAAEGVRAQGYEPRVRGGGTDPTGMARVDARIDYEGRMRRRVEEDYELIDLGTQLIYGRESGKGGVDALLGSQYADAMWWRFCAAESWPVVAGQVGYSEAQARRLVDAGLDSVDFFGLSNCMGGDGVAADKGTLES